MLPMDKQMPNRDDLPLDGPWSVGEAEKNGKVIMVRSNSGYRTFGSVQGYDHQLGIAVPLRLPRPSGLPWPHEDAELGVIEDQVCRSMEEDAESLFLAVITTNAMREFVFYTCAPKRAEQRFQKLRAQISTHNLQLAIRPDKEWQVYQQFAVGR